MLLAGVNDLAVAMFLVDRAVIQHEGGTRRAVAADTVGKILAVIGPGG